MAKVDYTKLTISKSMAEKLVFLGLENNAVFHHFTEETEDGKAVDKVGRLSDPSEELPAWTFEEVRAMIGHFYVAPDLPEPKPRMIDGEQHKYCVNLPSSQFTYTSGAEACAKLLEYLLLEGLVTPEKAIERYNEVFKPE